MKAAGIIALVCLLASFGLAAPLEKRAYVYVTETMYEVVDVTETITVTGTGPAPTTNMAVITTPSSSSAPSSSSPPPSSSAPPSSSPTPTSSSDYTWSYSFDQQEASPAPSSSSTPPVEAYVPPPSSTPPPPSPTPTPTPTPSPTPASTSTPAQQEYGVNRAYQPPPSNSGSGGGAKIKGELTHYEVGQGSCGWTNDGKTENVVALSRKVMANPPNGNPNLHPNCGRMIKITCNGKTEMAKVVDTCGDCPEQNVDAADVIFEKFAHKDAGRIPMEWEWA